jgi:hypothetical protein
MNVSVGLSACAPFAKTGEGEACKRRRQKRARHGGSRRQGFAALNGARVDILR